jgi:hypothetical protein
LIYMVIEFSIISGLATLLFRMLFSVLHFQKTHIWVQIIISGFLSVILWIVLILLARFINPDIVIREGDILCGCLILMCAFWCNYWIGNLAGGFRVQMLISLKDRSQPVPLEDWMRLFGNLGMEAFLKDRLRSILIPWKIVAQEEGKYRLLPGWGIFFGRLFSLFDKVFFTLRKS